MPRHSHFAESKTEVRGRPVQLVIDLESLAGNTGHTSVSVQDFASSQDLSLGCRELTQTSTDSGIAPRIQKSLILPHMTPEAPVL